MATSAIFVDKLTFTVPLLVKNWGTAFLVISLTGMIFPLTDWSFALGRKMGLKPETLPHVLLENFVATLFFNTTATLVLTAVNVFNNPEIEAAAAAGFIPSVSAVYTQSVIHDWPIMFIISYIFAFFVTKAAIKIARSSVAVSYTHLDVYKRQLYLIFPMAFNTTVGVVGYSFTSVPMALETAIRMAEGAGEPLISPNPNAWKDSVSNCPSRITVSKGGNSLKVRHL